MKIILAILVVMIAVFACGCTTTAPQAAAPAVTPAGTTATPDLVGVWSGVTTGHINAKGYRDAGAPVYNITTQKGNAFAGFKDYPDMNGVMLHEEFSGVINKHGEIFIAETEAGVTIGDLVDSGTMELSYIEDGDAAKAFLITLTRQ